MKVLYLLNAAHTNIVNGEKKIVYLTEIEVIMWHRALKLLYLKRKERNHK